MITLDRTGYDLVGPALAAGMWLVVGLLIGAGYFLTLRRNVRMLAAGRSLLLPLGFQLGRFVLLAAALAAITTAFGALPLLAATAGIVVARTGVIRWGAEP